jgi:geranylgeranyl pyrophosphate synthase
VPLVTKRMMAIDPALANLAALAPNVEWMNGLQFYLRRELPIAHGHVIHIDSEWALTSVSQMQFWRNLSPEHFGDSDVRGVLSVDISNWDSPGSDGRTAMECSREEVMREVWSQLKRSLNSERELLRDEDLHSWFLDPDIQPSGDGAGLLTNAEPLLVNLVDTWALRPEATTRMPNLFLASDYVRTYTDLATMEGANEAARRAVNGLLDTAGFVGPRCGVWPLQQPEILQPLQQHDATRYAAGLPWDDRMTRIAVEAVRRASPVLAQVTPLFERVEPYVSPVVAKLDAQDLPALDLAALNLAAPGLTAPGLGAPGFAAPGLTAPDLMASGSPGIGSPVFGAAEMMPPAGLTGGAVGRTFRDLTGRASGTRADLAGPGDFLDRLGWYRGQLDGTLAGIVPALEPQRHLYALVTDFLGRSGKGLRPALCIATTRALGGRGEDALFSAAGIEMLHNAFLVHDDIEDGSEERRGVATMHRRVGIPIAVNTGDAMNALAMRLFRRNVESLGPAAALRILDEVDHMLVECLEGQAVELGWVRDNDLTVQPEDYLRLVLKKTAWYSFIHPMRIGALVANPDDRRLDRFDRFGYLLGAAFQITDDVLNLTGDASRYGKEINGDLLEGKRTMALAYALGKVGAADRAWTGNFLSRPRERRLNREVLQLRQILARTGSIEWAQQSAAAFAEAARREFDETAFPSVPASPDLQWLRGCVDFIVQRDA